MKGAEYLAQTLVEYGVKYVFGVPSITSMYFYNALNDREEIQHVMFRSEESASAAAYGYAVTSLKPGLMETQKEHVPLFAANMMEAYGNSIPLILLSFSLATPNPPSRTEDVDSRSVDPRDLFTPITKWSFACNDIRLLSWSIRRAFHEATTGRPGPVYLEIPIDVTTANTDARILVEDECTRIPAYRTMGNPAVAERIANLLLKAENPVIIAGFGVYLSQATDELVALAELLGAPVATTPDGRGRFPEDHPLSLGVTRSSKYEVCRRIVKDADLVLLVGHSEGRFATRNFVIPEITQKVIHIDADPKSIQLNYPNAIGMVSDAKLGLASLLRILRKEITQRSFDGIPAVKEIAKARREWRNFLASYENSAITPISRLYLLKELRNVMPRNAVTLFRTCFAALDDISAYPTNTYIPYLYGCQLSLSFQPLIGAKLAAPSRPVIGLLGDGAIGYAIGDLETMARLGIAVSLILINNSCYDRNKNRQLKNFGRHMSTDFRPTNYANIAKELGLSSIRVERPEELDDALKAAVNATKPTLIDVVAGDALSDPDYHFVYEG